MTKRTIYLHVGPHKTGTTVLQKACLDNRNVLEAYGLKYPALFFSHIGHHVLVDLIRKKEITDNVQAEIKNLDSDIIFSSENFISLNKDDWQYFLKKFTNYNIKIIYAWRRSSPKMYSLWQENIKQGGMKNFTDFYYKELIRPGQSVLLCPHIQLDMWANLVGKGNIQILDYDASRNAGSLVSDFFGLLTIEPSQINCEKISSGIKNESLHPEVVEIIRVLNRMYGLSNRPSSYVREQFFKYLNDIQESINLISKVMSNYTETISVGDYFVDKISERKLLEDYKDNILNYKENRVQSTIKLIYSDWTIDNEGHRELNNIFNRLGLKSI